MKLDWRWTKNLFSVEFDSRPWYLIDRILYSTSYTSIVLYTSSTPNFYFKRNIFGPFILNMSSLDTHFIELKDNPKEIKLSILQCFLEVLMPRNEDSDPMGESYEDYVYETIEIDNKVYNFLSIKFLFEILPNILNNCSYPTKIKLTPYSEKKLLARLTLRYLFNANESFTQKDVHNFYLHKSL